MARFRIDSIADLARQLTFTPAETRAVQIDAAEELLHEIDPSRGYPFEFIVFRISGYSPQIKEPGPLLTGMALQHDLGLLVEHVSETLDLLADSQAHPVLQIEDVCQKFNVTSKTIQRWRRKGLPARLFRFADGKRRVGFQLASVERFFARNQNQVRRATNFSQVDEEEASDIIRRARRLAVMCRCCEQEITRRIGRKLNRSPMTIAQIIRRHDEQFPKDAIFAQAAKPIDSPERSRILRGYRRGVALRRLARRACRPKSAILRVITDDRLAKLRKRTVRFIDDPLYHQPEAGEVVDAIVKAAMSDTLTAFSVGEASLNARMTRDVPRDLPPYLADLYRTPLLKPEQERALFIQFNFRKYHFVLARRKLDDQSIRNRDLNRLETLLKRCVQVKNQILTANLRLVVSVAKKHVRPGVSLMELVSEGNLTLMRAVEAFNVQKGNKFSTYATLSLMKSFARTVPEMLAASRGTTAERALAALVDVREGRLSEHQSRREEVKSLLAQLDEQERSVLIAQFGLDDRQPQDSGLKRDVTPTARKFGQKLGLSKPRLRQIELSALAKLRKMSTSGE